MKNNLSKEWSGIVMYQLTLYVLGICCLETLKKMEKEIRCLHGISSFKAFIPKGKVEIEYRPSLICSKEIIDNMEAQGFPIIKKVQSEFYQEIYN